MSARRAVYRAAIVVGVAYAWLWTIVRAAELGHRRGVAGLPLVDP